MASLSELSRAWALSCAAATVLGGCAIDDRAPATANPSSAAGASGQSMEGTSSTGLGNTDTANPPAVVPPNGTASGNMLGADMPGGNIPPESMSAGSGNMPSGNTPGSGGTSGSADPGTAACRGCVELVVPVAGPDQSASFRFQFSPALDFSRGSLRWRVQVPEENTNSNFFLTTDVQNSNGYGLFENYNVLSTYNFEPGKWVDLSVDVSAHPPRTDLPMGSPRFEYTAITMVSLTLGTTETFNSTGTLRVLVDSVTFTGVPGVQSSDFTTDAAGLELQSADAPPGTGKPIHHP